ncbi:aminotransferase class IV [Pedobacter cryoconitis]|uniref:branched-chain-amino-acid transaminase n=1 Tax=Pedobacter cryoconitis TaxID=188932 RepID=A0A327T5Q5_9SPHI|nr:aminotransferase class IV [Pedobacter cryoconitis]RAJ35404.1 D-alanine transaminase/branched-chain amino acid aminotransferase [Pedobacter cryoconitis]
MSVNTVFLNHAFVEETQASLLVTDLSIQRGYGIFDFFKTINGKPVFLDDHIARFYNSAKKMHLQISQTPAELKGIIAELMQRNNLPDSGIKMTLTGGYSGDAYTLPTAQNLIITQTALSIPKGLQEQGTTLVTYPYQRQLAEMKTLDYSMAIWLQPFIKEHHADEVLYQYDSFIKETPRANFFIVTTEGEVVTAKDNILAGVIRKNILNLEDTVFQLTEREFSLEELYNASEAFITSTTKNILPVLKVDGKEIGDGKAGKVTAQLYDLLLEKIG